MDEDFRKRLRKTLYCGDLQPEDASLVLTDLSVEYFQGLAPHKLDFVDLHTASTVTSHDTVSSSSVTMGMIYAKRLQRKRPDYVRNMSSSDLFLISMMMASKYLYDEGVEEEVFNDEWAEMADLEKEEINRLEQDFLDAMDWELFIKKNEFENTMQSIERSVALREGLRRGWFSYTDLCILWGDPRLEWWMSEIGLEWLKVAVVSSAAYFAAAMTMVGSTVLVTNAPFFLATYGMLPVLSPGLQPAGIQMSGPLPQLHGLPALPATEFPSAAFPADAASFGQNETTYGNREGKLSSQPSSQELSWTPGKTIVETIMSQLMAVLTLKSHLVQFVSAVADNYTSTRARPNIKRETYKRLDCKVAATSFFPGSERNQADSSMCSSWPEMVELGAGHCLEAPHCSCGKKVAVGSGQDGFIPLLSKFPGTFGHLPTGQCSTLYIRQNEADGAEKGRVCGKLGYHDGSLESDGYGQITSISYCQPFPDITIGFSTSMLLSVYAT